MGERSLDDQLRGELMWSLVTDAVDMSNSSSSLSTEERHSNAPGSDPEGDGGGPRQPGTKKKEKNREAARKSRKKQTERADQLHQELESLEASNVALRKEISSLEKSALFYTAVLERHQPFCRLRGRGSASAAPPSVSGPVSAQASASTSAAATPSASFGGRSPSTPPAPTAPSCELFSSGSSKSSPHPSILTAPAPHSLFHDPPCPPPQTPGPGTVPRTPPDPLVEILMDSKPSPSHQPAADPGLFLSLLTVPSAPRGPQTSAGTSDGSLAQLSLLEDTSRDLGFQELLEVNDWILQECEMDPAFS